MRFCACMCLYMCENIHMHVRSPVSVCINTRMHTWCSYVSLCRRQTGSFTV